LISGAGLATTHPAVEETQNRGWKNLRSGGSHTSVMGNGIFSGHGRLVAVIRILVKAHLESTAGTS
jgi:hypothetical protein